MEVVSFGPMTEGRYACCKTNHWQSEDSTDNQSQRSACSFLEQMCVPAVVNFEVAVFLRHPRGCLNINLVVEVQPTDSLHGSVCLLAIGIGNCHENCHCVPPQRSCRAL